VCCAIGGSIVYLRAMESRWIDRGEEGKTTTNREREYLSSKISPDMTPGRGKEIRKGQRPKKTDTELPLKQKTRRQNIYYPNDNCKTRLTK